MRVQEFVGIAGFESNILEYNQEQLRVKTLDGCISTVRSFPSKKQVRTRSHALAPARTRSNPLEPAHLHTYTYIHTGGGGSGGE